jgi:S-adenosylmethionine hydrolase
MADLVELAPPRGPAAEPGHGVVIHVDAFGNLLTSIALGAVDPDALIEVVGEQGTFRAAPGKTFADVAPGALVAYVGSGGQLEIARRDGSAAAWIGASRGSLVRLGRTS